MCLQDVRRCESIHEKSLTHQENDKIAPKPIKISLYAELKNVSSNEPTSNSADLGRKSMRNKEVILFFLCSTIFFV